MIFSKGCATAEMLPDGKDNATATTAEPPKCTSTHKPSQVLMQATTQALAYAATRRDLWLACSSISSCLRTMVDLALRVCTS